MLEVLSAVVAPFCDVFLCFFFFVLLCQKPKHVASLPRALLSRRSDGYCTSVCVACASPWGVDGTK
jgi:hypothetical protein